MFRAFKRFVLVAPIAVIAVLLYNGHDIPTTASGLVNRLDTPIENDDSPNINDIVKASVSAVQARRQLLVMTNVTSATESSEINTMGMSARQVNVGSAEVQYFVDLRFVDAEHISVSKDGLTLSLPRNSVNMKILPVIDRESWNNDSWLFTFSNKTEKDLTMSNQRKIVKAIQIQAASQRDQAEINARDALVPLFEVPLRAAGFTHKVEVIFKN